MKGYLLFILVLTIGFPPVSAQVVPPVYSCEDCDFLVGTFPVDGKQLKVKPGDVICLMSDRVYQRVTFKNLHGTQDKPIIIRNCGGQARIYSTEAFGLKFQNSSFFKLAGDGSSDRFGITITTEKGFFLTLESFTTNFEVSRIEIAGSTVTGMEERDGFAGIGIKTSPYEDCTLFGDSTRQAWIMRDIRIHHNYIHDTGGEGLYIGHGFYKGKEDSKCPGLGMRYSHAIKGVRIYENLIENVGFDGIQIKNADEDVEVYGNIIRNFGTKGNPIHNEGLFIGEGTTGEFCGNIIDHGTGNGCQIQGLGNLNIHDNVFHSSGENGIYVAHGPFVVRQPDSYFEIHHNIISHSGKSGFVFYNEDGGPKRFSNNAVIQAGLSMKAGAFVSMVDNFSSNDSLYSDMIQKPLPDGGHIGISDEALLKRLSFYTWFSSPAPKNN